MRAWAGWILLASASLAAAQGPPLGEWKVTELTGSITATPKGPALALLRIAARHPRIIREDLERAA